MKARRITALLMSAAMVLTAPGVTAMAQELAFTDVESQDMEVEDVESETGQTSSEEPEIQETEGFLEEGEQEQVFLGDAFLDVFDDGASTDGDGGVVSDGGEQENDTDPGNGWNVEIESSTHTGNMLPGSSMDLTAKVEGDYDEEQGEPSLRYQWEITEGDQAVSLEGALDGKTVTVKAKELEEDADAKILVSVYHSEGENSSEPLCSRIFDVYVRGEYYEIDPIDPPERLEVGDSFVVNPVLKHFSSNGESEVDPSSEGIRYRVEWDSNILDMTPLPQEGVVDGTSFTVTRKAATSGTNITLIAERTGGEEGEPEEITQQGIWFDGLYYDISLTEEHEKIFTDETNPVTFALDLSEIPGGVEREVSWIADFWPDPETEEEEPQPIPWITESTPVNGVTWDGNQLSLDITTLKEGGFIPKEGNLCIRAEVYEMASQGQIAKLEWETEIRTPWNDYSLPDTMEFLLQEDGYVDREAHCCQYNAQHPDPDGVKIPIAGLEVLNALEGEEAVVQIEEGESGWLIRALGNGMATVKASYKALGENQEVLAEASQEIQIEVKDEIWNVEIESSTHTGNMLPGASMDLTASADWRFADEGQGEPSLRYQWEITEGGQAVSLEGALDGKTVTVKAKELEEDADAKISVSVYHSEDETSSEPLCSTDFEVYVRRDYYEIDHIDPPERLEVGDSFVVNPVLKHFSSNGESEVDLSSEGIRYRVEWDSNILDMTPLPQEGVVDGTSFTVTRKAATSGTNITLIAERTGGEEGEPEEITRQDIWFDGLYYDISLTEEHEKIFTDETNPVTFALDLSEIPEGVEREVSWIADFWPDPETEEEEPQPIPWITEGTPVNGVTSDGNQLSLDITKLKEGGFISKEGNLCIRAEVYEKASQRLIADLERETEIRDPYYKYYQWGKLERVPGEKLEMEKEMQYYVENAEHPLGAEDVTEVNEVTSDSPSVAVTFDQEKDCWNLQAKEPGTATITVEYVDAQTKSDTTYAFEICVLDGGKRYFLHWTEEESRDVYLPGEEFTLTAKLWEITYDQGKDDSIWSVVEDWTPYTQEWKALEVIDEEPTENTRRISMNPTDPTVQDEQHIKVEKLQEEPYGCVEIQMALKKEGETFKEYSRRYYIEPEYDLLKTDMPVAEPGDTVSIEDLAPRVLHRSYVEAEGTIKEELVPGYEFQINEDSDAYWSGLQDKNETDVDLVSGVENNRVAIKRETLLTKDGPMGVIELDGILGTRADGREIQGRGRIAVCVHDWDGGVVTEAATCTEPGVKTYTCKKCKKTRTETIPATGNHSWDKGVVTKAATCTEPGVKTYTCTVCKTTRTETIPATGNHTWNEGAVTKAATCTEPGVKTYTCAVCKTTKTETIPATGNHSWDKGVVTKAATCTEPGVKTYTCAVCKTTKTETIPATGNHTWNEGVVTKAATCTEPGVKTYTCAVCKTTKTEAIPAIGHHNFGEYTTVQEPTALEEGKEIRTCSICKETETRAIAKLEPTLELNVSTKATLTMKTRQTFKGLEVVKMTKGDYVSSWKSSNTKVLKVTGKKDGTCTLKAQKKTGTAKLTITLKSGKKVSLKVKVKKGTVKTTKITVPKKKISMKKTEKLTLQPEITPITSTEKVKYTSSNKNVVTVSSKGVLKAKKKGTASITIRSGKKKVKVKVTVK